ncbi:hypothetical protein NFJ02_02g71660 [Pycnococcus provasolii]
MSSANTSIHSSSSSSTKRRAVITPRIQQEHANNDNRKAKHAFGSSSSSSVGKITTATPKKEPVKSNTNTSQAPATARSKNNDAATTASAAGHTSKHQDSSNLSEELDALRSLLVAVHREREALEAQLVETQAELAVRDEKIAALDARERALVKRVAEAEAALREAQARAEMERRNAASFAASAGNLLERLNRKRAELVEKALAASHWERLSSKAEEKAARLEAQLNSDAMYRRVVAAEARASKAEDEANAASGGWRLRLGKLLEVLQWVVVIAAALHFATQSFAVARESLGFVAGFLVDLWMFTIAMIRGGAGATLLRGSPAVPGMSPWSAFTGVAIGAAALLASAALFVHALCHFLARRSNESGAQSSSEGAPRSPAREKEHEREHTTSTATVENAGSVPDASWTRTRPSSTARLRSRYRGMGDKEASMVRRRRSIRYVRDTATSPVSEHRLALSTAAVVPPAPLVPLARSVHKAVSWLQHASGAHWLQEVYARAEEQELVWNGARVVALMWFCSLYLA